MTDIAQQLTSDEIQHLLDEREKLRARTAEVERRLAEHGHLPEHERNGRAWFGILFEHSPDAIILIDPHDPVVFWPIIVCNDAACMMNGYTREELIGQSFDILHAYPTPREELAEYLDRLRRFGTLQEETLHRRKNGSLFPIEFSTSLINLHGRELILGMDRDISVRKDSEVALLQTRVELEARVAQRTSELVETNERLRASIAELEQVQSELRLSEQRYRSLVAATPQHVWITDPAGRLLTDLPAWRAFTGQSEAEILGDGWLQAIHPEDQAHTARVWADAVASQTRYDVEYRIRNNIGEFRHIAAHAVPVLKEDGAIREWIGSYSDITPRKQSEDAIQFLLKASAVLAESLDYAATLASLAQLAVPALADWCLIDIVEEDGKIRRVEVAQADPAQTTLARELHHYPPRPDHPEGIARVLRGGRSLLIEDVPPEFCERSAQDTYHLQLLLAVRMYSVIIVPLLVRGQVLGAMTLSTVRGGRRYSQANLELAEELGRRAGLAIEQARLYRDAQAELAERNLVEARLREQTETVEAINQIGRILSAELDLHNVVQAVTDAATELTGAQTGAFFYNVIDDQGERFTLYTLSGADRSSYARFPMPRNTDIFGPTFRGDGVIRLADVKQDPRYGRNEPYYGIPRGHPPVTSYLAIPVVSRGGEVLGGLFFGHAEANIFTERAEQIVVSLAAQAAIAMDNARLFLEAQEALRLRDQFLSIAAHELKTPITAILGYAQVLEQRARREGNIDERNMRAINTLSEQATRLSRLIHSLLDISRLQIGQMTLERGIVDLNQLIRRIIEETQPGLGRHRLIFMTSDERVLVDGDALRLEQVVQNLLQNAVKYSPDGGNIEVSIKALEGKVCITVRDEGIGIPANALPRLFNRFFRADNVERLQIGGMGVGLYVVKEIISMHAGTIRAESTEGQGSCFEILLPLYNVANIVGDTDG